MNYSSCRSIKKGTTYVLKHRIVVFVILFKTFISFAIIGGKVVPASDRTARHVVGLVAGKFGSCTGTLIDKNIVITAAHCIPPNIKTLYIVFSTNLNTANSGNSRPAIAALTPPSWGKNLIGNKCDIALVKFYGDPPSGYLPASILTDSRYIATNSLTLLAGFGMDNGITNSGAGELRETMTILTNPKYNETEALLDQTIGRGTCEGDSGGPAFIVANGYYFIWGITSGGDDACKKTGIYTHVLAYLPWINTAWRQIQLTF